MIFVSVTSQEKRRHKGLHRKSPTEYRRYFGKFIFLYVLYSKKSSAYSNLYDRWYRNSYIKTTVSNNTRSGEAAHVLGGLRYLAAA